MLSLGSGFILLLGLVVGSEVGIASPGWRELHPSVVLNWTVTADCIFVLGLIMAVEAIAVFFSIVRDRMEI
jgi:hypothetical protein